MVVPPGTQGLKTAYRQTARGRALGAAMAGKAATVHRIRSVTPNCRGSRKARSTGEQREPTATTRTGNGTPTTARLAAPGWADAAHRPHRPPAAPTRTGTRAHPHRRRQRRDHQGQRHDRTRARDREVAGTACPASATAGREASIGASVTVLESADILSRQIESSGTAECPRRMRSLTTPSERLDLPLIPRRSRHIPILHGRCTPVPSVGNGRIQRRQLRPRCRALFR